MSTQSQFIKDGSMDESWNSWDSGEFNLQPIMNPRNTFLGTPKLIPAPVGLRGGALKTYMSRFKNQAFTDLQKSALIGTLLGDSTIQYNNRPSGSLKFDLKYSSKEYVEALYFIFADRVGTPPRIRYKNQRPMSIWFRTYRMTSLDFYANQFYTIDAFGDRKKTVPPLVHRWLTPEAIAFWFMDDGCLEHGKGFVFHTEGFTKPDCIVLQQALGDVFHIESTVQPDDRQHKGGAVYWKIFISRGSSDLFQSIIEPFILPCMKYKLKS